MRIRVPRWALAIRWDANVSMLAFSDFTREPDSPDALVDVDCAIHGRFSCRQSDLRPFDPDHPEHLMCPKSLGNVAHLVSVQESFDSIQTWSWVTQGESFWNAVFTAGDIRYDVEFQHHGPKKVQNVWTYSDTSGEWVLDFDGNTTGTPSRPKQFMTTTGTGHAASVFATVIAILKAFTEKVKPMNITFTANEENRRSLYDRMIGSIVVPGYAGTVIAPGHYLLHRTSKVWW